MRTLTHGNDLILDLPLDEAELVVLWPRGELVPPPRLATVRVVPTPEPRLALEDTPGKGHLRVNLDVPKPGTRGIHHKFGQRRGLDTLRQRAK